MSSRQGREDEGLLLLEGTHLLQELIRCNLKPVELVATERWCLHHQRLLNDLEASAPIRLVTEEVLKAALSTITPDGVACLCPLDVLPNPPTPSATKFRGCLDPESDPALAGSSRPLAADVQSVWLGSGVDPLGSKSLRASAGALLQLPCQRFGPDEGTAVSQLTDQLKRLVAGGIQVVATLVPDSAAPIRPLPYWDLDWRLPTALVLGTEGAGLHPELLACCTHAVTLPHSPRVESLNVAAAAVPLLLERRRATMTATSQQHG